MTLDNNSTILSKKSVEFPIFILPELSEFLMEKIVEDFMDEIFQASKDKLIDDYLDFRVSSLPYCALINLEAILKNSKKPLKFSEEHYFKIGTVVHSNIQDFATYTRYAKTVFGNWSCACKRIVKNKFYPGKCQSCGENFQYEELEFRWRNLSGHLDLLAKIKGKWVAFEFKTIGVDALKNGTRGGYLPYKKHFYQINSYVLLLKLIYNIEVSHYTIIYVLRDKAEVKRNFSLTRKSSTPTRTYKAFTYEVKLSSIKRYYGIIKRASVAVESMKSLLFFKQNNGLFDNKYSKLKQVDEQLNILQENRPCKSYEEYEEIMSAAFAFKEKCKYAVNGSCFNKNVEYIKVVKNIRCLLLKQLKDSTT